MTYVPAELRQAVVARAEGQCEYCRYPQAFAFLSFEVEHIVAEKHGGATASNNLAWACPYCNRHKGSDLGSLDPDTGQLTPFFNPRTHVWNEHFQLQNALIVPLTPEGRVTATILQFNHPDRVRERQRLVAMGWTP